jgi:hypothetical protein
MVLHALDGLSFYVCTAFMDGGGIYFNTVDPAFSNSNFTKCATSILPGYPGGGAAWCAIGRRFDPDAIHHIHVDSCSAIAGEWRGAAVLVPSGAVSYSLFRGPTDYVVFVYESIFTLRECAFSGGTAYFKNWGDGSVVHLFNCVFSTALPDSEVWISLGVGYTAIVSAAEAL